MTDRELLELAAKAAGIELIKCHADDEDGYEYRYATTNSDGVAWHRLWDPLADDGDALRLAVKLRMTLDMYAGYCTVSFDDQKGGEGLIEQDDGEDGGLDDRAVTRRAITRAAAEIGRSMP